MSRITSIGKEDVHRITSGQVIVDLSTAVKELVENSIDAHSNKIEVTFKSYGIDSIEVSDDGDGIDEEDLDKISLKHYTSKLSTFEDVAKVKTLGFRGEAMSSLCAISNVKIITTQKAPKATILEFKHSGEVETKAICSRSKGTSIIITELFNNLPVRRKDFMKNSKKEFSKCLTLLQSYALISLDVKIMVYNLTPKGKKNTVLSSQGNSSMKNNIINVFGSNGLYGLIPADLVLDLNIHKSRLSLFDHSTDYSIKLTGYISKCSFGFGRSATDRQLFFINNRPVSLQPFAKAINEVYKTFNHIQYPVIILNLKMDPQFLDVNVTPDKRIILIHNESKVLEILRECLTEFYEAQDMSFTKNTQSQRILGDFKSSCTLDKEDVDDEVPVQSSLNTSSFAYTDDLKSELNTSKVKIEEDESVGEDKKHKIDFESTPQKKQRVENPVGLHPEDNDTTVNEDFEVVENDDGEADEMENNSSVDHDEIFEEVLEAQPKVNKARESILSSFRNNPGLRTRKADPSILKKLSSFRNEQQSSNQPKLKPSSLKPVFMKIGDEEIIQQTYIKKNGRLAFKDCDCGDPVHGEANNDDSEHESDIKLSDAEALENSEVYEVNEENSDVSASQKGEYDADLRIKDSNSQILAEDVDMPNSDNVSLYEERPTIDDGDVNAEEVPISERGNDKYDSISIKKDFNNRFLISNERDKDASRNYEVSLKLTTATCIIFETSHQEDLNRLEKIAIDNIDDQEESENKLTLTVSKNDFMKMKIIGQFNLGFILVIRQNDEKQDLFIVDQHASDEKYNFETLQKVTVFDSQPLVVPKFIELNALDELAVMDHKDVFIKNGFKFTIDEEGEPGARIKLVSLPISKKKLFDESDFEELIHLIKESQGNTDSVRCSKVRSMFAMRACRKSIMVGRSLTMKTMTKVVRNLGELDKPWNCPHGRPTMRHLMELEHWKPFDDDYKI